MSLSETFEPVLGNVLELGRNLLNQNLELAQGYSEKALTRIISFAKLIAKGIAQGDIDTREGLEDALDYLKAMVARFIRMLIAIALVTVERFINGVIEILLGAIKTAIGGLGAAAGIPPVILGALELE
ncbi:MAG: hypothetical protein ACPGOY_07965 [Rhodospirillaceae bacterium]